MNKTKHGKLSAGAKNCARYKSEGRLEKNKARKAARHKKRMARFAQRRAQRAAA